MGYPKGQGPIRSEASAKEGKIANISFSPQQIRSIKQSPKGKLPRFLQGGVYKDKNVASVGGKVGNVGGSIGINRKTKRPFGSVNYKGKIKGKFGS